MAGNFKRGGSRGGFKKAFNKKRSSPDDDDTPPRASKKARDGGADPLIPQLETDNDNNSFISVSASTTQRDFWGKEV